MIDRLKYKFLKIKQRLSVINRMYVLEQNKTAPVIKAGAGGIYYKNSVVFTLIGNLE